MKDLHQALIDFYNKLEASQVPLEPEFQKVIDDNFWELIAKSEDFDQNRPPETAPTGRSGVNR